LQQAIATSRALAFAKRPGQERLIQGRGEPGASVLPERRIGELLQPELAPALEGAAVGADELAQLMDPIRGQAMPHGRLEHEDESGVDPASEEAHRRRSGALATALFVAAKAPAQAPKVFQNAGELLTDLSVWKAARFAIVIGDMETASQSAMETAEFLDDLRQIEIDQRQENQKPCVAEMAAAGFEPVLGFCLFTTSINGNRPRKATNFAGA